MRLRLAELRRNNLGCVEKTNMATDDGDPESRRHEFIRWALEYSV